MRVSSTEKSMIVTTQLCFQEKMSPPSPAACNQLLDTQQIKIQHSYPISILIRAEEAALNKEFIS